MGIGTYFDDLTLILRNAAATADRANSMTAFDHATLLSLVGLVETMAKQKILPRFGKVSATRKADGSLLTAVDTATQQALRLALAEAHPDIPLLGEEMPTEQQERLLGNSQGSLWCLDPLDGTGNFVAGVPFFAVSLALLTGGRAELGIVHDPLRGESFCARRGAGAWLNGVRLTPPEPPQQLASATGLVDFKRLPGPLAVRLAVAPPYRSQRNFGSAALEWCWLAAGRCHLYLHGGQSLWDHAAGALILQEAGARGGVLQSYTGDWSPELSLQPRIAMAAASSELLRLWRAWVKG
jgi:myo-inositol-1(or 4)-monophosphatase